MPLQTIEVGGKCFVLIEESRYRELIKAQQVELPPADARGRRPAAATMRAMIGRDIRTDREKAGMTQELLALRAGVRQETISRLEAGKHSPNVATMQKIDRALSAASHQIANRKSSRRIKRAG